jgi:hypothetical protein
MEGTPMTHPNTFAAGASFLLSSGLVWLLKHYGIDLSVHQQAALVGGIPTAVLFVGRRGLKGTALALAQGAKTVWYGTQRKAVK